MSCEVVMCTTCLTFFRSKRELRDHDQSMHSRNDSKPKPFQFLAKSDNPCHKTVSRKLTASPDTRGKSITDTETLHESSLSNERVAQLVKLDACKQLQDLPAQEKSMKIIEKSELQDHDESVQLKNNSNPKRLRFLAKSGNPCLRKKHPNPIVNPGTQGKHSADTKTLPKSSSSEEHVPGLAKFSVWKQLQDLSVHRRSIKIIEKSQSQDHDKSVCVQKNSNPKELQSLTKSDNSCIKTKYENPIANSSIQGKHITDIKKLEDSSSSKEHIPQSMKSNPCKQLQKILGHGKSIEIIEKSQLLDHDKSVHLQNNLEPKQLQSLAENDNPCLKTESQNVIVIPDMQGKHIVDTKTTLKSSLSKEPVTQSVKCNACKQLQNLPAQVKSMRIVKKSELQDQDKLVHLQKNSNPKRSQILTKCDNPFPETKSQILLANLGTQQKVTNTPHKPSFSKENVTQLIKINTCKQLQNLPTQDKAMKIIKKTLFKPSVNNNKQYKTGLKRCYAAKKLQNVPVQGKPLQDISEQDKSIAVSKKTLYEPSANKECIIDLEKLEPSEQPQTLDICIPNVINKMTNKRKKSVENIDEGIKKRIHTDRMNQDQAIPRRKQVDSSFLSKNSMEVLGKLGNNVEVGCKKWCRTCAMQQTHVVSIREGVAVEKGILMKLNLLAKGIGTKDDKLPMNICKQCLSKLDHCYQFITQIIRAQATLVDMIHKNTTGIRDGNTDKKYVKIPMRNWDSGIFDTPSSTLEKHVDTFTGSKADDKLGAKKGEKETVQNKINNRNMQSLVKIKEVTPKMQTADCRNYSIKILDSCNSANSVEIEETAPCYSRVFNSCTSATKDTKAEIKATETEVNYPEPIEEPISDIDTVQSVENETNSYHECNFCFQQFQTEAQVNEHEEIHNVNGLSLASWRSHVCEYCFQIFKTQQLVAKHRFMKHKTPNALKLCDRCGKMASSLKRHYWKGHSPLECAWCNKLFPNEPELRSHWDSKHDKKSKCELVQCRECGEIISKSYYRSHLKCHKSELTFTCSECGEAFRKELKLEIHAVLHTGKLDCPHCEKRCADHEGFVNHLKTHSQRVLERIPCSKCGKMFAHLKTLIKHEQSHFQKRAFNCDQCFASFDTRGSLTRHLYVHSGLLCDICHCTVINKRSCQVHQMLIHRVGEKDLKCLICDDVSSSLENFRRHISLHQRYEQREHRRLLNRKTTCEYCGIVVGSKSSMKNHVISFHSDSLHICSVCGIQMKREDNMRTHMRIHTGEKALKCRFCEIKFLTWSQKIKHENENHRDDHRNHCDPKNIPRDPLKCMYCKETFYGFLFRMKHILREHPNSEKAHAYRKRFKCFLCDLRLNSDVARRTHIMRAHPESERASKLRKKRPTNTNFKCFFCSEIFKYELGRRKHVVRNHPDTEKAVQYRMTFRCPHCQKGFRNARLKRLHILSAHPEIIKDWLECKVCDFRSKKLFTLNTHMRIHTRATYDCRYCDQTFKRKEVMEKHKSERHPVEMSFEDSSLDATEYLVEVLDTEFINS